MSQKEQTTTDQQSTEETNSPESAEHKTMEQTDISASENTEYHVGKLGTFLRDLRNSEEVTLKQLSIDTKISESVLENLESENFESLPRKIYIKGFIKTYCSYFKTSPDKPLSYLEEVFRQSDPVTDIKGRYENHDGTSFQAKALIKYAIIIGVSIVSLVLIKKFFFAAPPEIINTEIITEELDGNTPLAGSPSNVELTQESIENKEKTALQETKQEEVTPVKEEAEKKSEDSEEGDQLPTEITFKKISDNYLVYKDTDIGEIKELIPSGLLAPTEGASDKVILSTKNAKTWIAYQKDDEEIKQLILKENKVLVISGNEVRLVIGNSNQIRLIHNQREVDIKSKTGIKSLIFPKKVAEKYRLPLFYQNSEGNYVSSGKFE